MFEVGRDSVGTATHYGLDGPGIESRWCKIFCTRPHRFLGPPGLLHDGHKVSFRESSNRRVALTTHPYLRLKKEYNYRSVPLRAFMTCSRLKFTCPILSALQWHIFEVSSVVSEHLERLK